MCGCQNGRMHESVRRRRAGSFEPVGVSALERQRADLFYSDLFGISARGSGLALPPARQEAEWESDAESGEQQAPDPNQGWCCRRQTMAAVARVEEQHWTNPANGAKLGESAASQRPFLVRYWMATGQNAATAANSAAQSAANNDDFAWSAAFICFVMRAAGIVAADGFDFGSAHMRYVVRALRNRERSDQNARFWLVDSVEVQQEATPEPGDLICFNRPVNGTMTTHSYSSLRTTFWGNNGQHQNVAASGSSHCALVVGTAQQGGQRVVETIGGNETNSVRLKRNVVLNQHGGIQNPGAHADPGPIFGMIKIMRC